MSVFIHLIFIIVHISDIVTLAWAPGRQDGEKQQHAAVSWRSHDPFRLPQSSPEVGWLAGWLVGTLERPLTGQDDL